jgi:hypothetical protein
MVEIPYNPNRIKNQEQRENKDAYPCIVCGKAAGKSPWMVRVVNGGTDIGTDEEGDADPSSDLGYYPIGTDCLRKHPEVKPYAKKQKEVTTNAETT